MSGLLTITKRCALCGHRVVDVETRHAGRDPEHGTRHASPALGRMCRRLAIANGRAERAEGCLALIRGKVSLDPNLQDEIAGVLSGEYDGIVARLERMEAWIREAKPYIEERRDASRILLNEERTASGKPSRSLRATALAAEAERLDALLTEADEIAPERKGEA